MSPPAQGLSDMAEKLSNKRIRDMIAAGAACEVRDTMGPGLIFRVRASGHAGWSVRRTIAGRDYRLDLGASWTVEEAREIAVEVDRRVRDKLDPWVVSPGGWQLWYARRLREKRGEPEPVVEPARVHQPVGPVMTWTQGRDKWLDEIRRTRRETTAAGYFGALRVAEMRPFEQRLVCTVTRQEMAESVRAIFARGAERQAQTTAIAVRGLFEFLGGDDVSRLSGVEPGRMERLKAPERTLDEDDAGDGALHVPDGKEIGALMRAIRESATVRLERDRLAAQLAVYSVQRRRMVASARIADFEFLKDGTALWSIPALHRKTASLKRRRHGVTVGAHVVPLPAVAAAVVKRAVELAGDNATHVFPSRRARRKDKPSLHMSPETLTHLFADLDGNKVSPHDVRRAFGTTYAKSAGMRLDDVKAILDHSEGVKSGDVTAEHYSFLSGTHHKWPVMRGWVAWVDAQIDDPHAGHNDLSEDRRDPHVG